MKKTVSMPCTEAQFQKIKGNLENVTCITNWALNPYLCFDNGYITNSGSKCDTHIPEFNKALFFKTCGIKPTTKVKNSLLLELAKEPNIKAILQKELPDLFPSLEAGFWYESANGNVVYCVEPINGNTIRTFCGIFRSNSLKKLTNKEAKEYLIKIFEKNNKPCLLYLFVHNVLYGNNEILFKEGVWTKFYTKEEAEKLINGKIR